METAKVLCAQLGFVDTGHQGPTRGPPEALLDDMRYHANHCPSAKDATLMAITYLHTANAGEKLWSRVGTPQGVFLVWGEDNQRITEVAIRLFDLIMNSERTAGAVVDVDFNDPLTSNEEVFPRPDKATDELFEDDVEDSAAGAKFQDQLPKPDVQRKDHGRGKVLKPTKTASKDEHESAQTDSVVIGQESSPAPTPQPKTNEQQSTSKHPLLVSLETTKRTRSQPQNVSPAAAASQPRTYQQRFTTKRQTPGGEASAPLPDPRNKSSSPEIISADPVDKSPSLRRPTRAKRSNKASDDDASYSPTTSKKPKKKATKAKVAVPSLPAFVPNQAPPIAATVPVNAVFHFFVTKETLGALPVPFAQCNSVDEFFARAAAAADFLGIRDEHRELAGVNVSLEGIEWKTVVGWNDAQAHRYVMDSVEKATVGRAGDLHVPVKCIFR